MDESPDPELLSAVRVIIRMARIAQQACEEGGLTMAQYRALTSAVRGKKRAYELAQYTAVSRPAISALTTGMVKLGLIERSGHASDGRGVFFAVTSDGEETLHKVEHLLVRRFADVLGDADEALKMLDSEMLDSVLDLQAEKDFGGPHRRQRQNAAKNDEAAG